MDTTNASYIQGDPSLGKTSKFGLESLGPLQLPKINAGNKDQSPFKGFLDISNVTQKLRKGIATQGIGRTRGGHHSVKGGMSFSKDGNPFKPTRDNLVGEDNYGESTNRGGGPLVEATRSKTPGKKQGQMNPKVLETWINETLNEAEHLDIPGVILKPEHKLPVARYSIGRLELNKAGIPNEMVDRIYRALFVYSVGFYEMIKKCLDHTGKKFSVITAIWKVFSILLEYCCRSDYRMLISSISEEFELKLANQEQKY